MEGLNIIEDTRNKPGKHDAKNQHFKEQGVSVTRCALPVGDYALMPKLAIDTKKDIYELAQNIDQEHERFRNELIRAKKAGCKLVILVENEDGVTDLESLANWSEDRRHFKMRRAKSGNMYARQIEGVRLAKACSTMSRKYGAEFRFCPSDKSGSAILEILKERGEDENA